LEFVLTNDYRYSNEMLASFINNMYWRYFVAIPILVVFGKFVAARYNIHWLFGAFVGLVALATCIEGYWHRRVRTWIADNSDCHERIVDQVAQEYRPEVLAKQVQVLLSNNVGPEYSVQLAGTDFVLDKKVVDGVISNNHFSSIRQKYCQGSSEWHLARAINYNLVQMVSDKNGKPIFVDRTTPQDCASSQPPSARATLELHLKDK
jgi:hypothetical protein